VRAGIERLSVPDHHIHGRRDPPEGSVGALGQTIGRLVKAFDHGQNVVVTIRSAVPTCLRTEEVETPRLEGRHEAVHDLL
jgi:hypothetical protein